MRAPDGTATLATAGAYQSIRQLDLDQHRLDVVGRQPVDVVAGRKAVRQVAAVQIDEQRDRLGVAGAVGHAVLDDGRLAQILDQRQSVLDAVGDQVRGRIAEASATLRSSRCKARMSGESLAIAA